MVASLISCKNGEDENGFTPDVANALNTFNGTFVGISGMDTETIEFTPFAEPQQKLNPMNDVPMEFHGTMHLHNSINDNEYYFHIDTIDKELECYGIHSEREGYFALNSGRIYEYRIKDNNTIQLHWTLLSDLNWNTYNRQ